jgi:hypothetical protein
MVRGVLLDSGLFDSENIEDYGILNEILSQSPISNDVLELELQDSDARRDELERLFPLVVTMSAIMVEAMLVNAKANHGDEEDEFKSEMIKSMFFTDETKLMVSTLLSGTAIGIISQLMEVKLLTKGWS